MLLVTGGSGFVGSHITVRARGRGLAVRVLARRAGPGIDYAVDLADPAALAAVPLDDVTEVVHCAAAVPARSRNFARDNVETASTLSAALRGAPRLRRLVHVSSISVYASPASGPWRIDEEAPVIDPLCALTPTYAQSKRSVEQTLDSVAVASPKAGVVHLRASSIYGPGMIGSTLLPMLVALARAGQPLVLRGPRGYVQNFIHVDDVADLAIAAAAAETPTVVNAFSDDTLGLFELADIVRTRLRSTSVVVDETTSQEVPSPSFVNLRAHELLASFRTLRDHLAEVA